MEGILDLGFGEVQAIEIRQTKSGKKILEGLQDNILKSYSAVDMQALIADAFQQVDDPIANLEDRVVNVVEDAFKVANGLQE